MSTGASGAYLLVTLHISLFRWNQRSATTPWPSEIPAALAIPIPSGAVYSLLIAAVSVSVASRNCLIAQHRPQSPSLVPSIRDYVVEDGRLRLHALATDYHLDRRHDICALAYAQVASMIDLEPIHCL